MFDTILTITFFVTLFGSLGYIIYKWVSRMSSVDGPHLAVKDPDKFGCH